MFIRLRFQIGKLRPFQGCLASLRQLENKHSNQHRYLLAERGEIKAAEFRSVGAAAQAVNMQLRGQVKADVARAGNRERLFKLLLDEIGGRMSEAVDIPRYAPELPLSQLRYLPVWSRVAAQYFRHCA